MKQLIVFYYNYTLHSSPHHMAYSYCISRTGFDGSTLIIGGSDDVNIIAPDECLISVWTYMLRVPTASARTMMRANVTSKLWSNHMMRGHARSNADSQTSLCSSAIVI